MGEANAILNEYGFTEQEAHDLENPDRPSRHRAGPTTNLRNMRGEG
jgi:hypothetical protein